MARSFAVHVNKMEAIRLLGAAMRKKVQDHEKDKEAHKQLLKEYEAQQLADYKAQVARAKCIEQLPNSKPYVNRAPAPPVCSLCDEKQLLVMLRADARKEVPIPEGSVLWTLIQGRCTPLK